MATMDGTNMQDRLASIEERLNRGNSRLDALDAHAKRANDRLDTLDLGQVAIIRRMDEDKRERARLEAERLQLRDAMDENTRITREVKEATEAVRSLAQNMQAAGNFFNRCYGLVTAVGTAIHRAAKFLWPIMALVVLLWGVLYAVRNGGKPPSVSELERELGRPGPPLLAAFCDRQRRRGVHAAAAQPGAGLLMRLEALGGSLVRFALHTPEGNTYWQVTRHLARAQGLRFLCPRCFPAAPVAGGAIVCWSGELGVPDQALPAARYAIAGTGLQDATLRPCAPTWSRIVTHAACGWRGYVTEGEVHE